MPEWFQSVVGRRDGSADDRAMNQDDHSALRDNGERVESAIRARWLLLFALVAYAIVAGGIALTTQRFSEVAAEAVVPLNALLFAVAYNFVSSRMRPALARLPRGNVSQFVLDVVIIGAVLVFSGGPESWFWVAYLLVIFEVATVATSRRDVWFAAAGIVAALTVVDWGTFHHLLPTVPSQITGDEHWVEWQYVAQRYYWQVAIVVATAAISNTLVVQMHERLARSRALSVVDEQTGLQSRTVFHRNLETELHRSSRAARSLYLVLIDIDNLTQVNARFGYAAGDSVILKVADTIRAAMSRFGAIDWSPNAVARVAGEEFAVTVVDSVCARDGAPCEREMIEFGEAVRELVAQVEVEGVSVTVSVGIASSAHGRRSAEELLLAADEALAASVERGGNRVSMAADDIVADESAHGDIPGEVGAGEPSNPYLAQFDE